MKNLSKFLFISLIAILFASTTAYSQISVVVGKNSSNTADKATIKKMFLGEKLNWPSGGKVVIADQGNTTVGASFYEKFLGSSLNTVRSVWTKLVLSGQASAPVKCSDDDAVKAAVAKDANAVGYIKSSEVDGSVKELFKIE